MTLTRTLVFRAKLSRRTHASLEAFLDEMRALWNAALEERIDAYRKAGVSITWVDQFKSLTEVRRALPEYARCSVAAQRSVLKRLDRAFQAFFRRHAAGQTPGFPRFRSRNRGVRSFEIPAPRIQRHGRFNVVAIKGIGKFRFAGEIEGAPKALRIVKTPRRVTVQIVVERQAPDIIDSRAPLGIDAGILSRIALSTGETVPGRWLDRTEITRRQRILSRAKRGSRGRCKKRLAVARAWQRVSERERGALHELTAKLVRGHGARIYVEDLKIPKYPDGYMFGGAHRGFELIQQEALGFMGDLRRNACRCLFTRKFDQAFGYRRVHSLTTPGPSIAAGPYIHSSRPACF